MQHDQEYETREGVKNTSSSDSSGSDGFQRRNLLKNAAVGVGVTALGQQVAVAKSKDTVQFSNVGISYRIEDDVALDTVVDCSSRRWVQRRPTIHI